VVVIRVVIVIVIVNTTPIDQTGADHHVICGLRKLFVWEETAVVSILYGQNLDRFRQPQETTRVAWLSQCRNTVRSGLTLRLDPFHSS
jgi:hypothetical protein